MACSLRQHLITLCAGAGVMLGTAAIAQERLAPTADQGVPPYVEKPEVMNFISKGKKVDLNWVTSDGKPFTNKNLEGTVTVVDIWAAWCPPCITTLPIIKQMHADFGEAGVNVVGLSFDNSREEFDAAVEAHGLEFTQVVDVERAQMYDWGPLMLPSSLVIGPDGTVLWVGHPSQITAPFYGALKEHRPDLYNQEKHEAAVAAYEAEQARIAAEREAARQKQEALEAKAWKVGDKPTFAVTLMDGRDVTAEDFRGQVLVLDFWATWCGPCMASMPHMKELYAKYHDQGLEVLGVSYDREEAAMVKTVEENPLPWLHTYDGERVMGNAFAVNAIPSTWILSIEGEILWKGHPMQIEEPLAEAMSQVKNVKVD